MLNWKEIKEKYDNGDIKDISMLEELQYYAEKHNIRPLMTELIIALESSGVLSDRVRLYTNAKAFKSNWASMTAQGLDVQESVRNSIKVVSAAYPQKLGKTIYTYALKTLSPANKSAENKFTSVFVGIGYSEKTLKNNNMLNVIAEYDKKLIVYTAKKSPTCLRFGYLCGWDDVSRGWMLDVPSTNCFGEDKEENINGNTEV